MKIKITTERLQNKYPKGEVYEVEELEGILSILVSQGEAEIVGEKTVEQVDTEVMDYKLSRDELKEALREKGIEFKGNAKTTKLEELLDESKKK